jgi:hypothetical protein
MDGFNHVLDVFLAFVAPKVVKIDLFTLLASNFSFFRFKKGTTPLFGREIGDPCIEEILPTKNTKVLFCQSLFFSLLENLGGSRPKLLRLVIHPFLHRSTSVGALSSRV